MANFKGQIRIYIFLLLLFYNMHALPLKLEVHLSFLAQIMWLHIILFG